MVAKEKASNYSLQPVLNDNVWRLVKCLFDNFTRAPFGVGEGFNRFAQILAVHNPFIADRTYHEIAGSAQPVQERVQDIADFHAMNRVNGGHLLYHNTIYYLYDRDHFEYG